MKNINYKKTYEYVYSTYINVCNAHNEKDYNRYLNNTDELFLKPYIDKNGIKTNSINYVYIQMCLHALNVGSALPNMVKFTNNFDVICSTLHNFEPSAVVQEYQLSDLVNKFDSFIDYDRENEKYTGSVIKRYCECLLNCAMYLKQFSCKKDVIKDLKNHYNNNDINELLKYLIEKIKVHYKESLLCDFIKELDSTFCDVPKPDRHIKRFTGKLLYDDANHYKDKYEDAINCINDFRNIVNNINNEIPNLELTSYKFDRMVYLICSGKFFLDKELEELDKKFLNGI